MSENKPIYNENKKIGKHNVGKTLRALMKQRRIDDSCLARAIGVAPSSLSRIKNDVNSNPTLGLLQTIANFFDITVSQLIGETVLNKLHVAEPVKRRSMFIKQIPLIAWSQIEAFANEEIDEYSQWITSNQILGDKLFALCVENASWGEVFVPGSYLLVDMDDTAVDGDYVVIYSKSQNTHYVKRLIKDGTESYLQSLNPELRHTEKQKEDEVIIGAVVEIRQQLKKITS